MGTPARNHPLSSPSDRSVGKTGSSSSSREQNLLRIMVMCENMLLIRAHRLLWRVGAYGRALFIRRDERGRSGGRKQERHFVSHSHHSTEGVGAVLTLGTHPYKSTYQPEQRQQAARLHGDEASPSSKC